MWRDIVERAKNMTWRDWAEMFVTCFIIAPAAALAIVLLIAFAMTSFGSKAEAAEHHAHEHTSRVDLSILEKCWDVKDPKFSTWGWCHDELHQLGFIQEVLAQTNDKCCGGPKSGECRVTLVDMVRRRALIDKYWVPLEPFSGSKGPKIAILGELKPGFAVVCAMGSNVYCVGLPGGQ